MLCHCIRAQFLCGVLCEEEKIQEITEMEFPSHKCRQWRAVNTRCWRTYANTSRCYVVNYEKSPPPHLWHRIGFCNTPTRTHGLHQLIAKKCQHNILHRTSDPCTCTWHGCMHILSFRVPIATIIAFYARREDGGGCGVTTVSTIEKGQSKLSRPILL